MISWAATIGPTARFVEQGRRKCADVSEDLALEVVGFAGCGPDAAGEAAQDEPGRELVGRSASAEATAAVEQPAERQRAQLVAEGLRRSDDDRAELCECFTADVDGAATGDQQQSQRLTTLPRPRQCERFAGQCCPRDADSVERVIFAGQPPLGS